MGGEPLSGGHCRRVGQLLKYSVQFRLFCEMRGAGGGGAEGAQPTSPSAARTVTVRLLGVLLPEQGHPVDVLGAVHDAIYDDGGEWAPLQAAP